MTEPTSPSRPATATVARSGDGPSAGNEQDGKPLVSIVVPVYNEAAILENNLTVLCDYLKSLQDRYRWELILVNDGSADATGDLAEAFAESRSGIRVLHHSTNFGLGQALRYGFRNCRGDYIVTYDIDLSYAPEHIDTLLDRIRETRAKIVLASPYMKGGRITHVPLLRKILSVWANRFLSVLAQGHLSTLTCMVRAYDGRFLRSMSLRSMQMDIMPEILYKAMILGGRIEQVPAHLDWSLQVARTTRRRSSMKIARQVGSTLLSGFILRPFAFLVLPGSVLLLFALWVNAWMFIHFFEQYLNLPEDLTTGRLTAAMSAAYEQFPYTFIVGLLALMLSIQLVGLGILALQSKHYFEEMFHLGTAVRQVQERERAK
jgi:hypothetical protein